jgi:hypothetical protein
MACRLGPHVAGQLGDGTVLDPTTYPPGVRRVEYVLDGPDTDDLIESFPIFLVTERLARRLMNVGFTGFALGDASVAASREDHATYGDAPQPRFRWLRVTNVASADVWLDDEHRLCVSDRFMEELRVFDLGRCTAAPI